MRNSPQAVLTINPGAFFLLSGTGQANKYPGMAWGNGFITDAPTIEQYNLSDPNAFFSNILAVPELSNRMLLSVHVYGPSVTVRRWDSNPLSAQAACGICRSGATCSSQPLASSIHAMAQRKHHMSVAGSFADDEAHGVHLTQRHWNRTVREW